MKTLPHLLRAGLVASAVATVVAFGGCSSMMPMSSTSTSSAAMTQFSVRLSGAAEVPPVSSAATGMLEASFDKATSMLRWKLTHSGLSGPATAAHLHGPAMAGANAGVMVPFQSAASGSEGQATLTAAQVTELMAGRMYANVHTAANPGGEIRGQLTPK